MSVDSTPAAPAAPPVRAGKPGGTVQLQLAVLTAVAGGVLAGGSYLGDLGLLVAVGVVQAALIFSWVFGTGLPGRIGALVLGVLASAGADAGTTHWPHSGYSPVLGVLALAIPLMFVHQLSRGVVRTRVVESLADITVLLISVVALSGLIVLRHQDNGDLLTPAVLASIAAGLVASHFTDAVLPAPRFDPAVDRGLPAVAVGIVIGGAVGLLSLRRIIDFAGGRGAFVGAAVAAVACLLSIGATFSGAHSSLPREPAPSDAQKPEAGESGAGKPAGAEPGAGKPGAGKQEAVRPDGPILLPAPPAWAARLRPMAAVLMTIALTTPAGYVLTHALAG